MGLHKSSNSTLLLLNCQCSLAEGFDDGASCDLNFESKTIS